MDAEALFSFRDRGACTDAERRASLWLHDELRSAGHEAWVETHWVRPQWAASLGLHAALGVAASLVSTDQDLVVPALVAAVVALISYLLELFGGGGLLRLFYRRATQVVVVEPPEPDAIALIVTAAVDVPRSGLAARVARLPLGWVAVALALVAAACAARVAGAEGTLLGALQFVPTLVLLLAIAAAIDAGTSDLADGEAQARAVAAAVDVHDELTRRPPERLSAGLWLAGAGEPFARGFRAQMRAERRRAADTVVLEIRPGGDVAWHTRHPQIRIAAESVSEPAAQPARAPRRSAAGAARSAGVAAVTVSGADAADYALALVDALDAELAASV
jgi:hypothetical protein